MVFSQLKAGGAFAPIGLARSAKAVEALKAVGAADDELVVGDVADEAALEASMAGVHAVILCTSAVPRIKKLSLAKTIAASLIGKVFKSVKPGRPSFRFGKGGTPEEALCRADLPLMNRGDAAAATRIFRRPVAATPRPRRGYSAETSREWRRDRRAP